MMRLTDVCTDTGRGRTALYDDVKAGLFTPPVKIGGRAIAWSSHEVRAITAARIAGYDAAQIKVLVLRLISDRSKLLPAVPVARVADLHRVLGVAQ